MRGSGASRLCGSVLNALATTVGAHLHCRLLIPTLALVAAIVLTAIVPALFVALPLISILAPAPDPGMPAC